MNLKVIKRDNFNNTLLDIYRNNDGDANFYMTRKQIGEALEYNNPQKAIDNIHERNKERLDKYSVTVKLTGGGRKKHSPQVEGYGNSVSDKLSGTREYDTCVYTFKGVLEICRWSNQPKANEFFDYIYDLLESLYKGELMLMQNKQEYERLQLPPKVERVFIQLVELMGNFGRVQISSKELGRMLGIHDTMVSVSVKKLQQMGYIDIIRLMYENGCNQPNIYILTDKAKYLLT